jgi:hypothetical protein
MDRGRAPATGISRRGQTAAADAGNRRNEKFRDAVHADASNSEKPPELAMAATLMPRHNNNPRAEEQWDLPCRLNLA